MICHEAKDRLVENRATAGVQRHLAGCEDCRSFSRELAAGGRAIADSMLSLTPGPGFEEAVLARMGETEIAVPRPEGRRAPVTAILFVLAAAAALYAFLRAPGETPSRPGEEVVPSADAPPGDPVPAPPPASPPPAEVVVTAPLAENRLEILLDRASSAAASRLTLRFAGEVRELAVSDGVDEALLRLWAFGARRAVVEVAAQAPDRDLLTLLESLSRTGFAYELHRLR